MLPDDVLKQVLARLEGLESAERLRRERTRRRSALCALAGKLFTGVAVLGLATWVLAQGLEVKTTDTATDIQRMKIETSSGVGVAAKAYFMNANLGIGTTNPDRPLTVQGTGASHEWISFKDTAGTTKWHVNRLGSAGFNFAESGVADGRLFLKDGGNVGVGTVSPDVRLTIASSTTTTDQTIKVYSQADAALHLVADTDNVTETDNPYVLFSQDGAATTGIIGFAGAANVDPQGGAYTGTANNDFLIGTISGNPVMIGTGADVKATFYNNGDVHFTGGYASAAPASSTGSAGFWFGDDKGVQTDPTFTIMEDSNDTNFVNFGVGSAVGVISVGAHDLYFKTGATEGTVNTGTLRMSVQDDGTVRYWTKNAAAILLEPSASASGDYMQIKFMDPDGGTGPMYFRYPDDGDARLQVIGGSLEITETSPNAVLGRGAAVDNWLRCTTTAGGATYHDFAASQLWAGSHVYGHGAHMAGAGGDLSEYMFVDPEERFEAGDVVRLSADRNNRLTRRAAPSAAVGVVTSPLSQTFIMNAPDDLPGLPNAYKYRGDDGRREDGGPGARQEPVALAGRVYVKAILRDHGDGVGRGDAVAGCDVAGVAARADRPGPILGRAMETFAWDDIAATGDAPADPTEEACGDPTASGPQEHRHSGRGPGFVNRATGHPVWFVDARGERIPDGQVERHPGPVYPMTKLLMYIAPTWHDPEPEARAEALQRLTSENAAIRAENRRLREDLDALRAEVKAIGDDLRGLSRARTPGGKKPGTIPGGGGG